MALEKSHMRCAELERANKLMEQERNNLKKTVAETESKYHDKIIEVDDEKSTNVKNAK